MGAARMLNAGGAWVGMGAWSPAVAYATSQCGIDYDRWNLEPPDDRASTVVELIR